jgi:hypothetical protein
MTSLKASSSYVALAGQRKSLRVESINPHQVTISNGRELMIATGLRLQGRVA